MSRVSPGVFLTGTDTEVGKTRVGVGMLAAMRSKGVRVAGYKPVAAGCEFTDAGWRNDDALALQEAATSECPYHFVNPVALPAAMAPHLAAEDEGVDIGLAALVEGFYRVREGHDWVLVEGAGGWRVPINATETLADLARQLALPVVMVVSVRLGCINHALLTAEAIQADGLPLAGWVANRVMASDETAMRQVKAIEQRLSAPLIGVVPELALADAAAVAECLKLETLV